MNDFNVDYIQGIDYDSRTGRVRLILNKEWDKEMRFKKININALDYKIEDTFDSKNPINDIRIIGNGDTVTRLCNWLNRNACLSFDDAVEMMLKELYDGDEYIFDIDEDNYAITEIKDTDVEITDIKQYLKECGYSVGTAVMPITVDKSLYKFWRK